MILINFKPYRIYWKKLSFSLSFEHLFTLKKYRWLWTLYSVNKTDFDIIAVSDGTGGTLIYIRNQLSYKTRNNLKIYISFELESTFIEICNPKKTNIIIGCIYKHPYMNIKEFNDNYLTELMSFLTNYLTKIKLYFFLVILTSTC